MKLKYFVLVVTAIVAFSGVIGGFPNQPIVQATLQATINF
jgi:hypothetical protein